MNKILSDRRSAEYLKMLKKVPVLQDTAVSLCPDGSEGVAEGINRLVLNPLLHGYVLWLLGTALRDGVQRLYFLARDGYLPCRAAADLCQALELPIECRYFYCSRASLRIPMYHRDVEEALGHICRGGMEVTPKRILLRAGLEEKEAQEVYPLLSLPFGWEEPIPYAQLPEVKELLRKSEPFLQAMCRVSREAFPAMQAYFRQEGILEPGRFALVDSGWTGTMQRSIRGICDACGGEGTLQGYYFGLYHLPEDCDPGDYNSFFFGPGWGLRNKVWFNNNLFEVVFSAPHGTVLGYRLDDGLAVPVLGEPRDEIAAYICGFSEQAKAYSSVLTSYLAPDFLKTLPDADLVCLAAELLKSFMCMPTLGEAEVFGTLPFSDDLLDAGVRELAEKLDTAELWRNHALPRILIQLGLLRDAPKQSAWFEGSAVRNGKHVRWHRYSYLCYKFLLYLRRR